jgi:hypothetical protein
LFGRFYIQGYFETLNIHLSQVHPSLTDYLTFGWPYAWLLIPYLAAASIIVVVLLAFYYLFLPLLEKQIAQHKKITIKILLCLEGLFWVWDRRSWLSRTTWVFWVIYVILSLSIFFIIIGNRAWLARVFNPLRQYLKQEPLYEKKVREMLSLAFNILLVAIGVLIFFFVIRELTALARENGRESALAFIQESASPVEVISTVPLQGSTSSIPVGTSGANLYIQKDLYFIFYSDDRYFLFSGWDPQTCRPQQVYIVDKQQLLEVIKSAPTPLPCGSNQIQSPPTPSQTPPSTPQPASSMTPTP